MAYASPGIRNFFSSSPKSTIELGAQRAGNDVVISIVRGSSREATNRNGDLVAAEPRRQNASYSSEIGMWIASSLLRAAGASINPAPRHFLYGPIATARIPIRRRS